jgi:hypothetical protein
VLELVVESELENRVLEPEEDDETDAPSQPEKAKKFSLNDVEQHKSVNGPKKMLKLNRFFKKNTN